MCKGLNVPTLPGGAAAIVMPTQNKDEARGWQGLAPSGWRRGKTRPRGRERPVRTRGRPKKTLPTSAHRDEPAHFFGNAYPLTTVTRSHFGMMQRKAA